MVLCQILLSVMAFKFLLALNTYLLDFVGIGEDKQPTLSVSHDHPASYFIARACHGRRYNMSEAAPCRH
jgi:hypothetical protein